MIIKWITRLCFFISTVAVAASIEAENDAFDVDAAARLFFYCESCHGVQGEGSDPIHAPALAGQVPSYVIRQLKNYRDGIRGGHQGDVYGQQMALMATNLKDDDEIEILATYVAQLPILHRPNNVADNPRDQSLFSTCVACHGRNGEGNNLLSTPKIGGLNALYLEEQLQHFINGTRGSSAQDTYGQMMRAAMTNLSNPDDVKSLANYISKLSGSSNR